MQTIDRRGVRPRGGSVPAERGASAAALLGRIADGLTVAGLFFVPIYVPNIGGAYGIVASDVLLGLAAMARGVHIAAAGVSRKAIYRQSYLLGVLGVFALAGVVAQFANHQNPIIWAYLRVVIATAGSVLLVATFGGDDWAANRFRLVRAFGLGCFVLALSSLQGAALQGRPIGWSIHPNALGHSCVMGLFAAIWLVDNVKGRYERMFWAASAVACLYAIMQSGSRGGLLGLWAGGVLYLALRGNLRAIVGAIAATWFAVLLVAGGVVTLPASNPINRLFNEETGSGLSNDARRDLLDEDFEIIGKSPIFGGGFADDDLVINVHVVYLQGWVAAGAVAGFCLMLIGATMLFLPFVTQRKDLALACGCAAVAVAWLFTNILNLRDQWLFIAIAFAGARSISVLRATDPDELAALTRDRERRVGTRAGGAGGSRPRPPAMPCG